MTHIDMSQSAKSYFRARRYDPFPQIHDAKQSLSWGSLTDPATPPRRLIVTKDIYGTPTILIRDWRLPNLLLTHSIPDRKAIYFHFLQIFRFTSQFLRP